MCRQMIRLKNSTNQCVTDFASISLCMAVGHVTYFHTSLQRFPMARLSAIWVKCAALKNFSCDSIFFIIAKVLGSTMLIYPIQSLLAVIVFALIHLFANRARRLSFHQNFLSIGSGIAIAYVFIDILPKLSKHEPVINKAIWHFFPYFEKHVYVMALLGFLLFFVVDHSNKSTPDSTAKFYFALSAYALLNILVGYVT